MKSRVYISTLGGGALLANYGTFFQHYALRCFVNTCGFVSYRYSHGECELSFGRWFKKCIKSLCTVPYLFLNRHPSRWWYAQSIVDELRRELLFQRAYHMLLGAYCDNVQIDKTSILVLGSDQVMRDDAAMWFGNEEIGAKRVVYAGSTDWFQQRTNPKWHEVARSELPKFQHVSVREVNGVSLCQQYCRATVVQVVDPVLLMERSFYDGISVRRNIFRRETLFCYFVNIKNREELNLPYLIELANRMKCFLRIAMVQGMTNLVPRQYRIVLSPCEFLSAFRDAKYVLTNSFHGSVFSALYHKRFLSVAQPLRVEDDQNARQRDFMRWSGLDEYWVEMPHGEATIEVGDQKWISLLMSAYPYGKVDDSILRHREFSQRWLRAALTE